MNYLRIAINANSKDRKFILFYADYLQEAWLSEVLENDTTKILKQFRCKNDKDVDKVAAYISKSGSVINLSTESTENCLKLLEQRLSNPENASRFSFERITRSYNALLQNFSKPAFQ